VNGLTVYVPPAYTRKSSVVFLDPESVQKLGDADIVLGVIGAGLSESCRQELNLSRTTGKPNIVMSDPAIAPQLQPYFSPNLIIIDPVNPDRAELEMVKYLKTIDVQQNAKKALIFLGTLALGLLIFAPQD
jgi:hypothetical protein